MIEGRSDYELSNGHAIYCLPAGVRHGVAQRAGADTIGSDPGVSVVGVDVGFSPEPGTMRAPDVSVVDVPVKPGWAPGVPSLAVEYADVGQDEAKLASKIADLLGHGTRYLWVVRLVGLPRVEAYQDGAPMRVFTGGEILTAPGVLQRAIPVESLWDPAVAREVVFRNLLEAESGHDSVEAIFGAGKAEGKAEGEVLALRAALRAVIAGRGWTLSAADASRTDAESDPACLLRWIARVPMSPNLEEIWV